MPVTDWRTQRIPLRRSAWIVDLTVRGHLTGCSKKDSGFRPLNIGKSQKEKVKLL